MNPERWQQIKTLLQSALEREPRERSAFLAAACADDDLLRQEIESLITSHEQAGGFIDSPAFAVMAESLTNKGTESLAGQTLSHYKVLEQIGAGGMGEVYLAEDTRLGRKVALKMLPAYLTVEDERVRRFQQEARAASALNHPNIITIYEIGEIDSHHFMATEFIDGETLYEHLKAGLMEISDALDVAVQVTSALCAAHRAGIVHRDIKPGNIMLRTDNIVKVLDFGLAMLTEQKKDDLEAATLIKTKQGIVMGTAHYMSPEQARGQKMDARTDIFSLGVVLYEMLTGRVPFAGETMTDVLASILMLEPPSLSQSVPEAPEELHRIVHSALRKDKEERYQTAGELLTDLKAVKQQLEFELQLKRSNVGRKTTATERSRPSVESKAIESLAVLPLVNVSADPNMEYFSDGVTESIINALSQLPELRVVARSTIFHYKGREVDPQEVGQELGVRAVLTGRVRQVGDQLMIAVELIDVAKDSQLWGEHYNRVMADVFAVQEDIAREITDKLRIKLTGEDKRRLAKRSTANPEAYHAYLKGRYYWNKRATAELKKGLEHFREAIDLAPSYASAYAGVSDSYTLLVVREAISPEEGFAKAKAAAGMALKIDQDLSEAHASLGHALLHNWEWQAAEKELKRAIALNPGYPSAHHWYSEHLTAMGRFDESLKELELARELDPLSLVINADLGRAFYFARQYDETIKQENKTLEMDPHFWLSHINLGRSYTQKEMYAQAISELQTAHGLSPGNTEVLSYLGFVYAAAGDKEKAQQALSKLEEQAQQSSVPPYHLAIIHAGLQRKEQAFEWLERAYERHAVDLFTLNVEPMFDQLRSEPRFTELVRRIGLAPSQDELTDSKPGGRLTTPGAAANQAIRTSEIAPASVTSSAEYVAGGIKRNKTGVLAVATIVVLIIAGLVYSSFTGSGRTIDSLAVLPFLNASGDPNTEYLSDGIAESIIYSTSQLPNLKVLPRSSVVRYKGKEVDPQTVGSELGVRAVLSGRVVQRGDDLSISAELIDIRDNRVLWGQKYTRKIGDILAVQEEIAREISENLRIRLTTEDKKQLAKKYTENAEAYQLYLKGRYYLNKRTADGYQRGIDHFQQAIEKDPNYALAYTGLADSYMLFGRFGVVPPRESMPKAKAAATRALEIDDELAEAHTSLAYIKKEYDWDFQGAEAELKRAIQLNPNYPTAHFWYALYLEETFGRIDEALAKIERAQELEPLSLIMSTDHGMILYLARRYDQAIEQFRKTLEMDPNFFRAHLWLGRAYAQKGMYNEAVEEFQKARQLDDTPLVLTGLGHAFAASGRRGDAQKVLNELSQLSKRMYVDSYYVAAIHAALGDKEQAFRSLEKAYDDRSSWLSRIKVDPVFDSLHSDPRFANLVQRIGLP